MKLPELLGPGGSFDSAIYALENGADSVYIGLKEFSARASAKNFSFDELRRLKSYADKNQKKIYVALNTLIKEDQWPKIREIIFELSLISVDALILQDLGLIHYLNKNFPQFKLHGSTQLSAHNHGSVEFLRKMGLKRIVLPRELSLSEIKDMINSHPDMEFEVFIHGALCFGFSGMCLASGILLGRSGNRGTCGQICRTWFQGPKGKGYYFSTKDLAMENDVQQLVNSGVHSLKIEGRMKSPEYAGLSSAYYHSCLNQNHSAEKNKLREQLSLVFSRKSTKGFLSGQDKKKINLGYPSHLGVKLGQVLKSQNRQFAIKLRTDIAVRDGLMYLHPGEIHSPLKWAIKEIREISREGHFDNSVSKGKTVWINSPQKIPVNADIYKISGHNLTWKTNRSQEFNPSKAPFNLIIKIGNNELYFEATFPGSQEFIPPFYTSFEITCLEAKKTSDVKSIFQKIFNQSDQVLFLPQSFMLINKTQWKDDLIFYPPKDLKNIRKAFYSQMNEYISRQKELFIVKKLYTQDTPVAYHEFQDIKTLFKDHHRKDFNPKNHLPFVTSRDDLDLKILAHFDNWIIIPLGPLSLCSDLSPKALLEFIKSCENKKFLFGLNHYHHIETFSDLFKLENCFFYVDYLLYAANFQSIDFLQKRIPRLLWIYYWIEDQTASTKDLKTLFPQFWIRKLEKDFNPTLFISRFCFTADSLGENCCNRNFQNQIHEISQQNRIFRVIEKQGISYLIQLS